MGNIVRSVTRISLAVIVSVAASTGPVRANEERAIDLYNQALDHYSKQDWRRAFDLFSDSYDAENRSWNALMVAVTAHRLQSAKITKHFASLALNLDPPLGPDHRAWAIDLLSAAQDALAKVGSVEAKADVLPKMASVQTRRAPTSGSINPPKDVRLSGVYTLQQLSNRRFMDAHEVSSKDFSVVTRPAQNNRTQMWIFKRLGPNTYTIRQQSNGRYLDAHEVKSRDYDVVTRPAQNDDTQKWVLEGLGNNVYTIYQKSSGRYLDAHEVSSVDFRIVTRPAQNNDTQRWIILKQ